MFTKANPGPPLLDVCLALAYGGFQLPAHEQSFRMGLVVVCRLGK
jgi:hypothetical protein